MNTLVSRRNIRASDAAWLSLTCGLHVGDQHVRAICPGPNSADGWSLVASVADFNFDSLVDVAWYNALTNTATVWLMNGTVPLAPGPEISGPPGDGWSAVTNGDFNYDGMADLVWNNTGRNSMAIWLMNGTELLAPGPEIPGPLGGGWSVVASAGDFNFDGMADVLWSNADRGALAVWLMAGSELLAPGPEIPGPLGDGWVVPTNGDFDFDGMLDAVWQASSPPRMAVWLMRATSLIAGGPEIPGPQGP